MLLTILLIMFAIGMLAQGVSAIEVAVACGLLLASAWGRPRLERWVEIRTGRTSMTPTGTYNAVELGVMMLIIAMPPFFLPGAHSLVLLFFFVLAICVGGPIAQAYFGKRTT